MHIIAYIFPLMQNFFLRRDFCLAKQTAIRTDYITKQRHVKKRAERSFVMVSFISYKKIRRKRICACLCAMLFALTSFAATAQEYSWYFKPASGHAVPEVIPEAAGFIGKHAVIYLGSPEEKRVYLTFDAGYENGNVEKILDVLKEKNVPGAFFILPQLAKENTELVRRMRDEGHLICNHTKTHRNMSKITDFETFRSELCAAEDILREHTGLEMDKFYRPPEGRFSEQNLEFADRLGYTTVFWSLAYADWDNNKQLAPERALELVLSRTHNGCVALLHPTSSTNAAILGRYIDTLRAQGYTFGSLNELVNSETPEKTGKGEENHEKKDPVMGTESNT